VNEASAGCKASAREEIPLRPQRIRGPAGLSVRT